VPWTYRPSLDGLRSVAVYLVLLFHAGLPALVGGFVGVDLFFVLSGFLVTSVILSEIDTTGGLSVGAFYARRVRRLLPAAVVVVVATALVFLTVASVVRRLPLVGDARSALLYYSNWHFLGQSSDYFATDVDKSPYLHFWSLSIEEQFYFVFPLLLVLVIKKVRVHRHRALVGILSTLMVLSVAAQLYWAQVDVNHAYYGTDARLYQLLAGALAALVLRTLHERLTRRAAGATALAGLGGLVVVASGLVAWSPSVRGLLAAVASVVAIVGLMGDERSVPARLLSRPLPVFLGKISYGTYLWHWPVIVVLGELLVLSPLALTAMTIPIATALAALSYEVVEMPIRSSTLLKRFRWRVLVVGIGASAVFAVTLVPTVLHLDQRPHLVTLAKGTGKTEGGGSIEVPPGTDWAAIKKDVGEVHSCMPPDVDACTVVKGKGPHVLVVGDSHAQMLTKMFTKMAKQHDLTMSFNIDPGCPWQENLTNAKQSREGWRSCEEHRVGWYDDVLPKLKPDVILLVSRERDEPKEWADLVARRDGREQPLDKMVYYTTSETLQKLSSLVPRTLVVQSMVMPNTFEPDECLNSRPDASQCAVSIPTTAPPSDGYFQAAAAASPRIWTVDFTPALCPGAPVCEPVVHGDVVWRDDHHVTATYALHREEQVWEAIRATGVLDGLDGSD
jgi:peptidoglycan/LPS O-acetylase OafA/YrhL